MTRRTSAIRALFFLSGLCALVYQIVWLRMLVLVFGLSVFAVTTVLTAFMAGLALGSFGFGRLIDRRGRPLRAYAFLELGVGLVALGFPEILGAVERFYVSLAPGLGSGSWVSGLVRFIICFSLLLVPTTLIGATLPALSAFAVRSESRIGREIGGLYTVNTLGAAVGCALAAFVLLERLGVQTTIRWTAVVNLAIAAASFYLARGEPTGSAIPSLADEAAPRPAVARAVFWGFALSGFAALGYEVVWTRLLSILLSSTTTQSLSLILVAYLVGLAAGGAAGARLVDRVTRLPALFGLLQLLLGLYGIASVVILGALPAIIERLEALPSWGAHVGRQFVVASVLILAPTFLMGLTFPIASRIHVRRCERVGRHLGDVYAVNTLGAILGAFLTGFVLIPLLGTQRSLTALGLVNLGVGVVVLLLASEPARRARLGAALLAALAAVVLWIAIPTDAVPRTLARSVPGARLLHFSEETAGTVTVYESPGGERLLKVNGAEEVPTNYGAVQIFRLLGTLPFVAVPRVDDALVIAFGGGITLASVEAQSPGRLRCVEMVPGVVQGARLLNHYNNEVASRVGTPGLELVVDDGRNWIASHTERHDVIVIDATHPATADSWVLYTEDFYRICRNRLTPEGALAQWVPMHGLSGEDFRMIVRSFRAVFPHATLWVTRQYAVMLATGTPLSIDGARLSDRLARANASLTEVDLGDPVSFLGTLGLDEFALARFAGSGPTNTDDRPWISFTDRFRGGSQSGIPAMLALEPHLVTRFPSGQLKAADDLPANVDRRLAAGRASFSGAIALRLGQRERARARFREALAIDPGEPGARRALTGLAEATP